MTLHRKVLGEQGIRRALDVVLLLVCAVPLLYAKWFVFPFVVVKVYVFQALVGVAAALWLTLVVRRPSWWRLGLTPIRAAVLILLVALLVSGLAGVNVSRSLWSTQERALGLIALLHFAMLGLILSDMNDELPSSRYLNASSIVSVIVAIFALVEIAMPGTFLRSDPTAVLRPGSFFRNPTFLAAYLLPHIFFIMHLAARALRNRAANLTFAWCAAIALETLVVFLTQTRGAILGLAAGLLALGGCYAIRGSPRPLWRSLSVRTASRAALLAIGLLGAIVFFTRTADVWQKVPGLRRLTRLTTSSVDIQPRMLAFRAFWQAAQDRPLLGYGFENGSFAFNRHYDPRMLRYGSDETRFDKPHNVLLEYAVVGGLLGLGAFVGFLTVTAWQLFRSSGLREFTPFGIGLLAAHVTNNLFFFDTFGSYLGLFLLLGFADAHGRTAAPRAARRPAGLAREHVVVAGIAAVVCATWLVVNVQVLLANERQYQMLTRFASHQPQDAMRSFDASLAVPVNPYRYETRRAFAATISELVAQGAQLPDAGRAADRAMREGLLAIQMEPADYFLRISLADFAGTLSRFDRSYLATGYDQIRQALRLSPKRQEAYFTWAKLKTLETRGDDALALMGQAVAFDPENGDCQFYYSLLAFDAGKTQAGFAALEIAAKQGRPPRSAPELRVVGARYADAGNHAQAIAMYNQAIALDPNDLGTRLQLGLVYYSAGDRDAARQQIASVAQATDLTLAANYALLKPILADLGIATGN